MISVGSMDGRKLSGLGSEMEVNELEEGEAGCLLNDGDASTIDPDITLSYIVSSFFLLIFLVISLSWMQSNL